MPSGKIKSVFSELSGSLNFINSKIVSSGASFSKNLLISTFGEIIFITKFN